LTRPTPPPIYRFLAPWYEPVSPWWLNHFYRSAYSAFDEALKLYLHSEVKVLDLGCGTGALLDRILRLNAPFEKYTGIDISPDMLKRALAKYSDERILFYCLDINSEPLPTGNFDLIVSAWAFEHFDDPKSVVIKAWEQLNPGGSMLLLFEIDTQSVKSLFIRAVWRLFQAQLLPADLPLQFPGFVDMLNFRGPLGTLSLVLLKKPSK